MILPVVGLYKAKGVAAMLCDRLHGNTKSGRKYPVLDGQPAQLSPCEVDDGPDRLRTRCP